MAQAWSHLSVATASGYHYLYGYSAKSWTKKCANKNHSILKIRGNFNRSFSSSDLNTYSTSTRTIVYSKSELFKLKAKYTISHDLYSILKDQKLLRARGIRSGLSARNKICSIPVHTSHRDSTNLKKQSGVNLHNLQH